jgi:hypothetical protein
VNEVSTLHLCGQVDRRGIAAASSFIRCVYDRTRETGASPMPQQDGMRSSARVDPDGGKCIGEKT